MIANEQTSACSVDLGHSSFRSACLLGEELPLAMRPHIQPVLQFASQFGIAKTRPVVLDASYLNQTMHIVGHVYLVQEVV